MSGGISWLTLPAGYLGSSLIGACLIACGFNTNASKIASIVMAVFFLFTLWWARKSWLWVLVRNVRIPGWLGLWADVSSLVDPGYWFWVCQVLLSCFGSLVEELRFGTLWVPVSGIGDDTSCLTLNFQVLFIGVMSCMYVLWDIIGRC